MKDLILPTLSDEELLRRMVARLTPERRGVALVRYDLVFAR